MAKGKIIINEEFCKGCGYCEIFCPKECIEPTETLNSFGVLAPVFAHPDKCNGCGVCGWMCPDFAIDVFKMV